MKTLVPFSFESFNVRVITDDNGEMLFVAKDAAEALEYKDPTTAIKSHCKGVQELHPLQTAGGTQNVRVIGEPDLYRLIAGSTLPSAERFEKWLFEEVLPSIRKTGGYQIKQPKPKAEKLSPLAREVKASFNCFMHIAKLCGIEKNMAVLSANQATAAFTGINPLSLMGQTHITADPRGRTYTPTELGKMMRDPMSGKATNKLLEEKGYQLRDIKGGVVPTDSASDLYQWMDTGKRHGDGTPVKQLKWFVSVLDALGIAYQVIGEEAA